MNLLIRKATIIEAGETPRIADVLIHRDGIVDVSSEITETAAHSQLMNTMQDSEPLEIIEAEGLYLFPGFVDAHCHLRDPGQEYKEDIASGTRSAAAGGFTDIACMPNTDPVVDNKTVVRYIMDKAATDGVVRVHPIGTVTKGMRGAELSEMGLMKEAGIVAVSDDGRPVADASVMLKAMTYAHQFGLKVISHCEVPELADGGAMNEGVVSTRLGLRGIPTAAEDVMVSREIILSEYTGIPVHIAHVSTALSVQLIRDAKKRGVKVTAETCPHYFTLTEEACLGYRTEAKMNPPLRTQQDVEAVVAGLRDGTLDMIATDHAPHHRDEKEVEFDKASNGIVGFETAFSLAVTHLVKPGHLSLQELADRMSRAPAIMLGLPDKRIAKGHAADLTLVDIDSIRTIDRDDMVSKGRNTPYHGWNVNGVVKMTMVEGRVVARDGKPVC